jgi:uncharacterized protein (TIGR00297 family)
VDFGLRLFIGMIAGALVGLAAHRARSLTGGGAAMAAITGTAAVAAGWDWAVLLIVYFISSTALSRIGRATKLQRTAGIIEKPGPRDGRQVLANGFVFLCAALAAAFGSGPRDVWMAVGAGSLAASAADTWATEIGTLVGQTPRSILNGRPLQVGQSGGVTTAGSLASLAGAILIAALVLIAGWSGTVALAVIAGGLAGSLSDSLIGATIQQRRWCDACEKPTEMFIHKCSAVTRHVGGAMFIENDAVNLMANTIGGGIAALLFAILT